MAWALPHAEASIRPLRRNNHLLVGGDHLPALCCYPICRPHCHASRLGCCRGSHCSCDGNHDWHVLQPGGTLVLAACSVDHLSGGTHCHKFYLVWLAVG